MNVTPAKAVLVYNPVELFRPISYLYGLIRLVTGDKENHSVILIEEDSNYYVVETLGKTWKKTPALLWWNREPKRKVRISDIRLVNDKKIENLLKQPYDFSPYILIFLYKLGKLFNIKIPTWKPKGSYCHRGTAFLFDRPFDPDVVTATELENFLNPFYVCLSYDTFIAGF
jgi:hypothetical protein